MQPAPLQLDAVGRHIERAARYLERHGWLQGGVDPDTGAGCVGYALDYDEAASRRVVAYLRFRYGRLGGSIPGWNDTVCRSTEMAAAMLREAARFGLRV